MRRIAIVGATLAIGTACHHHAVPEQAAEPVRPLAAYAQQRLLVTPAQHVRSTDSLGWIAMIGGTRNVTKWLDSALVVALTARGLAQRWVMPAELLRVYDRNRTYLSDPYQLAVEQVRAPKFKAGDRYAEPLSSQLRTMIALQEDARFVLLPVDVRFEKEGTGGHAVVRVVIIEPRYAEARWVGDIQSAVVATPVAALNSVAVRLVDLFVAP